MAAHEATQVSALHEIPISESELDHEVINPPGGGFDAKVEGRSDEVPVSWQAGHNNVVG